MNSSNNNKARAISKYHSSRLMIESPSQEVITKKKTK